MAEFEKITEVFATTMWGIPLVCLLFGAGLFFTFYHGFPQFRFFRHAIDVCRGKFDRPEHKGEISHFQALCAALSATIGLGNIAGVAVAISVGGPGAVFWMWVAGLLGMATKFTSISLALIYREQGEQGEHGGPMYTIKNGLGKAFMPLAVFYAFCTILSSFGAGNMFQANQMASILEGELNINKWLSAIVFCFFAGLVLIGGIKRIGSVASKLVPVMVVLYFIGAVGIIFANIERVPDLIASIFTDAFGGTAAVGGFAGVAFREVLVQGVRRAVFSNEAGMGSAAMAHSAAKSSAVQEGIVGALGPFIDTIVVCTLTALVLLITGVWSDGSGLQGSQLTAAGFATLYGDIGSYGVMVAVVLFAFSTIISWSYYGEQGTVFLFGEKGIKPYRWVFLAFIICGAIWPLQAVLNISDGVFALLCIPNLIANILLGGKLKTETAAYAKKLADGKL